MSNYIESNQVVRLVTPAAASVLNLVRAADSGKILILSAQTAIQTFTLPLPEPGLQYKIVCDAVIGFNVIFATNPVAILYGNLTSVSTVAITTATVAANLGSFPIVVAAKNGANSFTITAVGRAGDYVDLVCDGTYWNVNGTSTAAFASGATAAATLLLAGLN